ncbi:D-hexose-6-phosphate mutarotase [Corynebacterium sp.]|uniref:aldose epimerase family protein n=1 Tax=Corynebacterium sp. TaxID=1720 RepID=UPI0026DFD7C8|nr:D-hexose-6-phosphate mutarotase [Corynebacterium sp.]MDO5511775.1 D-hexose-6-phosphate mutarotase [Corynebacterium sp.]
MDDLLTAGRMQLSPAGAHVTSTETDLGELFYLSSTTGFPIRGGIPVIAPSFAELMEGRPRHGFARTADWRVTTDGMGFNAQLVNDGLHLTLSVREQADGMRIELHMRNESTDTRRVQMGFHPYFLVSDVREISVEGLGEPVLIDAPVDRIFAENGEVRIVDKQRVITVTPEGSDATVVWNPGEADMPDVGPGEWSQFVCVEPAILGADRDGVDLAQDEQLRLAMTVTVSPS